MARFLSFLVAFLAAPLAPASGEESRYVPIPFEGNFESLFKARLRAAKETDTLGQLLDQIRASPKQFNLDPAQLQRLNLDDPALREMLRGIVKSHEGNPQFTPSMSELAALKKGLEKFNFPDKAGQFPSLPSDVADPNGPAPVLDGTAQTPSRPRKDLLNRWLGDLVDNVKDSNVGDWLKGSQAFQKGLMDFETLMDLENNRSSWTDSLPEHLRLPENLNIGADGGLLDKLVEKFKGISVPEVPAMNLPRVNLGNWSLPAVPLPNLGRPGGTALGEALLWAIVLAVAAVLVWHVAKNFHPRGVQAPSTIRLGPWPIAPDQIATRSQLVEAFEYFAVLVLGSDVRTWNHRAIARKLTAALAREEAVATVTLLYEQARYTAGPEFLSAHDQEMARRELGLLAGTATA